MSRTLLPSDDATERAFLASLILARHRRLVRLMAESVQPAGREVFFDPWNAGIYDGIAATWKKHRHCDVILLAEWMKSPAALASGCPWINPSPSTEGSTAALIKILNSVPSAVHGVAYGVTLKHLWKCRQIYVLSEKLARSAVDRSSDEVLRANAIELMKIVGINEEKEKK